MVKLLAHTQLLIYSFIYLLARSPIYFIGKHWVNIVCSLNSGRSLCGNAPKTDKATVTDLKYCKHCQYYRILSYIIAILV